MDVPEERESRRELIDVEAPRDAPFDIGEPVGKREGELLRRRRAGLANVIAGDRDRIPLWGLRCSPLEAVDDEAERRLDRKAPRVLRHVLFQNVVLNSSAQLVCRDAVFFGGRDVKGPENDRRAVDSH